MRLGFFLEITTYVLCIYHRSYLAISSMYTCGHVCMGACVYVCMCACVHVHVCMCACACVHVCMCACVHTSDSAGIRLNSFTVGDAMGAGAGAAAGGAVGAKELSAPLEKHIMTSTVGSYGCISYLCQQQKRSSARANVRKKKCERRKKEQNKQQE